MSGRIPGLDGLRGVAITLVVALHVTDELARGSFARNVILRGFGIGWIGVDLFFVLSGYLITTTLLDRRHRPRAWVGFYARRALRILPLYYLVVACLVGASALAPHRPPEVDEVISKQAWLWLHGANVVQALENRWVFDTPWYGASHFWSLAIEEQFYLVWPIAVLLLPERALLRVCMGLVLASLLLRIVFVAVGVASIPIYVLLPTRFDTLAAGAAVAIALRDPGARHRVARVARAVALGGLLFLATIFVARRGRFAVADPLIATVGLSVVALTFAALIAHVISAGPSSRITAALEHRVLRAFGHYSYGAYVAHWLILPPLASMAGPSTLASALPGVIADLAFVAIALVFTALLAVAMRHLWEERFLRLKRYF